MKTSRLLAFGVVALLGACGGSEPGAPPTPVPGSGGATGTGGDTGPGPSTPTGGAAATGGAPGTGGVSSPTPAPVDAGETPTPPPVTDGGGPPATPVAGGAPYGCTGCTRLFDGKTLDGWVTIPGAWVVKDGGLLASTGKAADLYTKKDFGDYRLFFQIQHLPPMGGKDHQPCVVLFGNRPTDDTKAQRSLGGAQFQPPNGYSWDYGIGGKFTNPAGKPKMDATKWNQCEVVVKASGAFNAACCPVGDTPCKTSEVLTWTGKGRPHPIDLMMHNDGLFNQYREIWIEESPKDPGYLSQK